LRLLLYHGCVAHRGRNTPIKLDQRAQRALRIGVGRLDLRPQERLGIREIARNEVLSDVLSEL
jgi:hypothetical protein